MMKKYFFTIIFLCFITNAFAGLHLNTNERKRRLFLFYPIKNIPGDVIPKYINSEKYDKALEIISNAHKDNIPLMYAFQVLKSLEFIEFSYKEVPAQMPSTALVFYSWIALANKDYDKALSLSLACIDNYQNEAEREQELISENGYLYHKRLYWALNDVGTSYYIAGICLLKKGKNDEAYAYFDYVIKNFPNAYCYAPANRSFWNIKEYALKKIKNLTPSNYIIKDKTAETYTQTFKKKDFITYEEEPVEKIQEIHKKNSSNMEDILFMDFSEIKTDKTNKKEQTANYPKNNIKHQIKAEKKRILELLKLTNRPPIITIISKNDSDLLAELQEKRKELEEELNLHNHRL